MEWGFRDLLPVASNEICENNYDQKLSGKTQICFAVRASVCFFYQFLRERTKTGQNRAKRCLLFAIATRVIEVFGCVSNEENMLKKHSNPLSPLNERHDLSYISNFARINILRG